MIRKAFLGVLSGVIILGSLSCSWFDNHNDIVYPGEFYMNGETPGDPVTLNVEIGFGDQTPDTSGVIFDWERRSDTLGFLLKGMDGEIDHKGPYENNYRLVNLGFLEPATYTVLFEGEKGVEDTFGLVVEDSLYRFVHRQKTSIYDSVSGKVVYFMDCRHDTLRRIFPDMLLVEVGAGWGPGSEADSQFATLKSSILQTGAVDCVLSPGTYSMFTAYVFFDTSYVVGSRQASQEWYDAVNNGLLGVTSSMLFTYDSDTASLSDVFEAFKDTFPALSIRMGNGFDRYYFYLNP